jgi:hypothetical protein
MRSIMTGAIVTRATTINRARMLRKGLRRRVCAGDAVGNPWEIFA